MKIGIITVHDLNNFGAFLQAYGLKYTLEQMGHKVFHIRSYTKKYARGMFYRIRPYGREYLHLPTFIVHNLRGWKKHQVFLRDLRVFQVVDQYDSSDLDLIILGSDEIWNTTNPLFQQHIFFGEGMDPVMAYAPSIGNATVQDLKCIPSNLFHRIDPILVRDELTQSFVRSLGIDAPRVCDPTILTDPEIFARPYHHHLMKKPYLLVYAYGHEISQQMRRHILAFARSQKLKVYSVGFHLDWCDGILNSSPLDFCAVLQGAEYVFTATFHGSIFSVLNHTRFVSLPYSPKTTDLLRSIGLGSRLIDPDQTDLASLTAAMKAPIDYESVDATLRDMRSASKKLLEAGIHRHCKTETGG